MELPSNGNKRILRCSSGSSPTAGLVGLLTPSVTRVNQPESRNVASRYRKKAERHPDDMKDIASLRRKLRTKEQDTSTMVNHLQETETQLTYANDKISQLDEKHQQLISELKNSITKLDATLKSRTHRYLSYREKKEAELLAVRKKAKLEVDAINSQHEKDMQRQKLEVDAINSQHKKDMQREKSRSFLNERNNNKTIVSLQAQLQTVEMKTKNKIAANEEDCDNIVAKHRYVIHEETYIIIFLPSLTFLQFGESFCRNERDIAVSDKLRLIESNNVTVNALIKNAVKTATSKERQHYSAVMLKEKKKRSTLSVQVQKEKELAQSFLDQKIAAERETRTATRQSNRSQMRSTDAGQKVADSQEEITTLRRENQEMADEMDKMESLLQDTRDKLKELRDASPIEEIKKERDTGTHGGGSS